MTEYKWCTTSIASGNALDELQVKTGRKMAWFNNAEPTVCIIVFLDSYLQMETAVVNYREIDGISLLKNIETGGS